MSKNKDLGTAYGMKRRGNAVAKRNKELLKNQDKEAPSDQTGVNTASTLRRKGVSDVGAMVRNPSKETHGEMKMNAAKNRVRETIGEIKSMPKPKLPMAKGGKVDHSKLAKMYQDMAAKASPKSAERQSHEINAAIHAEKAKASKLAAGGTVTPKSRPDMQQSPVFKIKSRDEDPDKDINDVIPMDEAEDMGDDGEPAQPEDSDTEITDEDAMDDHMAMMADGGELEMDHHESMVAAIMSRRDQLHAEIDSGAHDLDEAVRMADGGMVDIDENAEEQPNELDSLNEDAIMKENYDSDMDDVSEPEDSNEHSDEIDSDDHDMVSKIRKGMKRRQR